MIILIYSPDSNPSYLKIKKSQIFNNTRLDRNNAVLVIREIEKNQVSTTHQLVGDVGVVLARHALADGGLHETRQRRQHVDRRVDLPVVKLTIDVDLALSDVSRQIGNRMGYVVVGHGENGNLGDGAVAALDSAGALVDGREIGVHVAGETTTSGYLLTGCRYLQGKSRFWLR